MTRQVNGTNLMLTQKEILIKESLKETALPHIVSIFSKKKTQTLRHFQLSYFNISQSQNDNLSFASQDCKERIKKALNNNNWGELDWSQFWLKEIASAIGFRLDGEDYHVRKIDNFLKEKFLKIVFIFDGIENIFQEISTNKSQQMAIRALINIPQRLTELKDAHFGIIIFIYRDSLAPVITQNLGQFQSCYSEFDLDKKNI